MSINSPASIAFTGDVAITITVSWSTNPAGSTISNGSFTRGSVNATTYHMLDVFDNPENLLADIATVGSCSAQQASRILQQLQFLVQGYDLQTSGSLSSRMSVAVS